MLPKGQQIAQEGLLIGFGESGQSVVALIDITVIARERLLSSKVNSCNGIQYHVKAVSSNKTIL